MASKRLVLHVGSPKTGTTALQSALSENENSSLASGVHYLRSFRRGASHNYLMKLLAKDGSNDAFIRRKIKIETENASSGVSTFLVSSETSYGAKRTKRLLEVLPASLTEEATIVLYFRRQDLFIEAMAKQKVKNGGGLANCKTYIHQKADRASYVNYVRDVAKAYPGIKFECRVFDRNLLDNADIVSDFFKVLALELPRSRVRSQTAINKTPTIFLAEAMGKFSFKTPVHRRQTLRQLMRDRPEFFRSRDVLDKHERRVFMERFKTENEELSDYCGHDLVELFHDSVDWDLESNVISDPMKISKLREEISDALVAAATNSEQPHLSGSN